eukprot:TRINITY_DN6280_c0_g1_i1.p1 TRINITY_DN6280_c0_g1~~TRINITY_DN6280_c0_g1_i1.p1  ORF type:complete len:126 (+),score=23.12 TRINITY_DN6280_c0_g1_i1:192-569(+)
MPWMKVASRNQNHATIYFLSMLFLTQFGGFIAMTAYYAEEAEFFPDQPLDNIWNHFYPIMGLLVGLGFAISFIMLCIVTLLAGPFIYASFFLTIALFIVGSAVCFSEDQIGGGIAFIVLAVLEIF